MKKSFIILAAIAAVVVIGGFSVINTYTNTRNEGNKRELALTAFYSSTQAGYGQFRTGAVDMLGIADTKKDAAGKILKDAIEGRYNKPNSPQVDGGKVFSAIKEAYPNMDFLNIYDRIMPYIQQGREKFAQAQTELQTKIQDYDTWRTTGSFLHPFIVGMLFPSDNLKARIGANTYTGAEALKKMAQPIVDSQTAEIFDSGVDQQIVPRKPIQE